MSTGTETAGRTRVWYSWSPAQILVAGLGAFLIVLAVLVLARGGIGDWMTPRTAVWGFRHTPLMAVIELGLGLLVLTAATDAVSAKGTLTGIGALMGVFGAIVLLDPTVFRETLGANRAMGVLYAAAGIGAFVLGAVSPVIRSRTR